MSVEKNPNGAGYRVRWRDPDGRQRAKTVRLWRDAVTLDGEIKRKRAMGELIAHEKGAMRLCDFWPLWVAQYAAVLSPRTQANYDQMWRKHLAPTLGQTPLRSVSRESVAALVIKLNQVLSPASVRKALSLLQSVYARAIEWGYVATNPAVGIRKPRLTKTRGRALTWPEQQSLVAELPSLRDVAIVETLASSGLRPGEIRALCWEDLVGDRVLVTKAASGDQVGPTKTGTKRSTPLDGNVNVLREWYLAQGKPPPRHLVFPGADGRLWTDNAYKLWQRNVFSAAARRAGLRDLRPYDLRHTYASRRIAAGANILLLAAELGHSPTMTLTVYGHVLGGEHELSQLRDVSAGESG